MIDLRTISRGAVLCPPGTPRQHYGRHAAELVDEEGRNWLASASFRDDLDHMLTHFPGLIVVERYTTAPV